VDLNEN